MAKITIILSLKVLCLVLFCSTYGEDQWKEQIQKPLVRASEIDFYPFWNYWGQTTTVSTTVKVTSRKTVKTTKKVKPRTTVKTTAKVTTTKTTRPSLSFTTFQNEALAQTNKYRASHCAPNLILNSTLNYIAQTYATKLVQIGFLVHSNSIYGENLYNINYEEAIDINSIKGSIPVDSWYSEINQYNWTSPGFSSATGHFTQLVWINTKQMGIGIAFTRDMTKCYIVANYSPPGNYENEYQANVKQGSSC